MRERFQLKLLMAVMAIVMCFQVAQIVSKHETEEKKAEARSLLIDASNSVNHSDDPYIREVFLQVGEAFRRAPQEASKEFDSHVDLWEFHTGEKIGVE